MQGGHPVAVGRMLRAAGHAGKHYNQLDGGNLLDTLPNAAELLRLLDINTTLMLKQPSSTSSHRPHVPLSAGSSSSSRRDRTGGDPGSDEDIDNDNDDPAETQDKSRGTANSAPSSGSFYQSRGSMSGAALSKGSAAVAGSQFRVPTSKPASCEQCHALDQRVKKCKESVRGLKLQLARAEETIADHLRRAQRGPSDPSGPDDCLATKLLRRCEDIEAELTRLRKQQKSDQAALEGLREAAAQQAAELAHHKAAAAALRQETHAQGATSKEQQRQLDVALMDALQYKTALEHSELRLQAMLCREKVAGGRGAADAAEIEHLSALLQVAQQEISQLSGENCAMRGDVATAQADLARAAHAHEAAETASRSTRAALEDQASGLCNTIRLREATIADRDAEQGGLQAALAAASARAAEQDAEMAALRRLVDAAAREGAERDLQAQQQQLAMQRAIASSVRLCIVAPSVNVHVDDKRMRFKSALAEQALGSFLRAEVLSKYSFLFKQKDEEDVGADGAGGVDGWIDKMLGEMQRSIEAHVAQAVDSGDK